MAANNGCHDDMVILLSKYFTPLILALLCPLIKNEVADPHFLLMNLTSKPQLNFLQILIKILGVDSEPP